MMTITATRTYTLRMGNDCTLYIYDERGCKCFESNPNDSINVIDMTIMSDAQDCKVPMDAAQEFLATLTQALAEVGADDRMAEMINRPSWKLLGWLL